MSRLRLNFGVNWQLPYNKQILLFFESTCLDKLSSKIYPEFLHGNMLIWRHQHGRLQNSRIELVLKDISHFNYIIGSDLEISCWRMDYLVIFLSSSKKGLFWVHLPPLLQKSEPNLGRCHGNIMVIFFLFPNKIQRLLNNKPYFKLRYCNMWLELQPSLWETIIVMNTFK